MKTIPFLACGLLTATTALMPLQTAQAKHDRHQDSRHDRPDVVFIRHHDDHHNDRCRVPHQRYRRPSSGVIFSFNFDPTPRYVVPVRTYDTPRRSLVADVQAALDRRGYDVGYIDGVAGRRTREALADFQHDRGLRVTGEINEATLRALGL